MLPKLLIFILGLYHLLRPVGEKEKETGIYIFSQLYSQVLNSSVANALVTQGKFYTQSTMKCCRIFDKAFDCLNVARISLNCKEDLKPYATPDDPRFDVSGFEYVLSNLNYVFLKNRRFLQKILVATRISVTRVCHGLKYRVFCHRQEKYEALTFRLSLSIGVQDGGGG